MQGESILLLILIFIILVAVIIISALYFMYTSKYEKSNLFYKNLLEVIKADSNLPDSIEKKLEKSDFEISDLSTSERNLSNFFGTSSYSEEQLNKLNTDNQNYSLGLISSNILEEKEKTYYQKTYKFINNQLSNLYALDFNNEDDVFNKLSNLTQIYNIDNPSGVIPYSTMNTSLTALQSSSNIFVNDIQLLKNNSNILNSYYTKDNNDLRISSNLQVKNLKICNDTFNNCYTLSVNDNGFLIANPNIDRGSLLSNGNNAFVFGNIDGDTCNLTMKKTNNYESITL